MYSTKFSILALVRFFEKLIHTGLQLWPLQAEGATAGGDVLSTIHSVGGHLVDALRLHHRTSGASGVHAITRNAGHAEYHCGGKGLAGIRLVTVFHNRRSFRKIKFFIGE